MKTQIKNRLSFAALSCLLALSITGCGKTSEPTASATAMSTASTASTTATKQETPDADVTRLVENAFTKDELLRPLAITVATRKGDVKLTGVLDNQGQIDRAVAIAKSVEGAHSIHDELTIRK